MPDHHPAADALLQRLTRLEEAHGFADHKLDQLAEQLSALNRAVESVSRRLAALENRQAHDQSVRDHLAAQPPPAPEDDKPPHW